MTKDTLVGILSDYRHYELMLNRKKYTEIKV